MNKVNILLTIAFMSGITCCDSDHSDCVIDYEFKANFYNCINIIATREAGLMSDENAYTAYSCLKALSGGKGYMVFDSDTPLSYNYSDTINYFCKDLQEWISWYEKNQCEITNAKAKVLLRDSHLSWPKDIKAIDCETHIVSEEEMDRYLDSVR